MILTCPECATRYQTDAAAFTPHGRKVRCAKCGHVWFQAPPAAEPEADFPAPEPAAPEAEAVVPQRAAYVAPEVHERPAAHADAEMARPSRSSWLEVVSLTIGWLALAGMVAVIGWLTMHYRESIANVWPQSSSFYAVVGMPVNTRGFEVKDKDAHFETENGQDVLVVTGHFTNITQRELSVPLMRVSLVDADKREVYHWNFAPDATTLRGGQSAPFRTSLPNPPQAARNIEIRFAERAN